MRKNNERDISVIIPVYNVEHFLPQCIESIIGQTVRNLQIILVDDGSTDTSGRICDEYAAKDNRIVVIHQKNLGVSAARNAGIDIAVGEYIAFADSDDVVPQDAYENLLKQAINCQLVIGQVQLMTEDGDLLPISRQYGCTEIDVQTFLLDMFEEKKFPYLGYPFDKLFRRSIIRDNNLVFDRHIKLNEDRLFVLQYIIKCNLIYCSDKVIYYYRQRSSSVINETRYNETVTNSELTVIDSFRKMQNICADLSDEVYYVCCRKSFECALDLMNRVSKQDKIKKQLIQKFLNESARICLNNPQYGWKEKFKIAGHKVLKR